MPDESPDHKKTALDRLIGSLKGGTIGAGLGAGAGVGLGILARGGKFGPVAAKYAAKRLSFFPTLSPTVTHAIGGASVGSKIGGLTGLLVGRKPKDTKELSSLIGSLIRFDEPPPKIKSWNPLTRHREHKQLEEWIKSRKPSAGITAEHLEKKYPEDPALTRSVRRGGIIGGGIGGLTGAGLSTLRSRRMPTKLRILKAGISAVPYAGLGTIVGRQHGWIKERKKEWDKAMNTLLPIMANKGVPAESIKTDIPRATSYMEVTRELKKQGVGPVSRHVAAVQSRPIAWSGKNAAFAPQGEKGLIITAKKVHPLVFRHEAGHGKDYAHYGGEQGWKKVYPKYGQVFAPRKERISNTLLAEHRAWAHAKPRSKKEKDIRDAALTTYRAGMGLSVLLDDLIQFGSTGTMHMARALLTLRKKGPTISRRVPGALGPEIHIQTIARLSDKRAVDALKAKAHYKNLSALRRWNPGVPDKKLIDPGLSYSGGRGWEHSDLWYQKHYSRHNTRMARAAGLNPTTQPPFDLSVARNLFNKVIEFKTLYQPGKKDEPPESLPELKGVVDYNVQRHAARRAGLHRDIRIGTRRHGLLSWATRKDLPGEGGRIAIHPQPVHPHSYLGWEGNIPEGYGAGDVSTEHLGKALVTKSTPTEVHATLADQKEHHRLALVKTDKGWLMTRGRSPEPPKEAAKPKYKSVEPEKAHEELGSLEEGSIVQPKVDGALVYVTTKGNRPEVFSHRKSKTSGRNIIHTERFFHGRPTTNIPREHQRTLLGELYGTRGGKAIEPQELGGILNTHLGESIAKQKARGVKLKIMPFDVAGQENRPYPERLEKVKESLQHLPRRFFQAPETATTPDAARKLYEKIRSGRHSLTKEGVIIHPPKGRMIKIKNVQEENVKIHSIFPGKGKFKHGGFYYTDKSGQPLGKVGTGFTEETRAELPKYIGRTARVRYQEKFKSGKLRAPSLIAIEENK